MNTQDNGNAGSADDDVKTGPDADLVLPDEIEVLKNKARVLGIQHSNNIGVDSLRKKIQDHLAALDNDTTASSLQSQIDDDKDNGNDVVTQPDTSEAVNPLATSTDPVKPKAAGKPARKMTVAQHIQKEGMKLIRVRITNMDPKKKDLPGEIITVANSYLGTVRKFVPFGEVTDNGYHIPQCLLKQLEARKFLNITTRKGAGNQIITKTAWAKEFAIEILPPLTEGDLSKLATAQLASGSVTRDD